MIGNLKDRLTLVYFISALILFFAAILPLKKHLVELNKKYSREMVVSAKLIQAARELSSKNNSNLLKSESLLSLFENEISGLGLEQKLSRVNPEPKGLAFQLSKAGLPETLTLLNHIEKNRPSGKVTFLKLVSEAEKGNQFSVFAKFEEN